MKTSVQARLDEAERALLREVKQSTGQTDSEILQRGLQLVAAEVRRGQSALQLAGTSVGRFKKGPRDLSTNKNHLEAYGR